MKKSDPVFIEENAKLESVVRVLRYLIKGLETKANSINRNRYTRSDSKEAYMDVLITRGEKEKANEEIEIFKSVIPCPYFCRFDIVDRNNKPQTLYFGKRGLYESGIEITNWETDFYLKGYIGVVGENNEFSIKENVRFSTPGDGAQEEATYRAVLKRALDIQDSELNDIIDEYYAHKDKAVEGITDPFLQKLLLEKKRVNRLTDIIRSIQRNQADIITHDLSSSFILQGCAGSGKTMILLHRLSYLKFNNPHLDLGKVKIITPSKSFNVHIHGLVIDLELNKIETINVSDYYLYLLKKYEDRYITKHTASNYSKQYGSVEVLPDMIDSGLLDYIYSEAFVSSCATAFDQYFENIDYSEILVETRSICERVKYNAEYVEATIEDYRCERVSVFLSKIIDGYNDRLKQCDKKKYDGLKRELKSLNSEIRQNAKDRNNADKKKKTTQSRLDKSKSESVSDELETELLELWIRIDELNEISATLQAKHLVLEQKVYQFEREHGLMNSSELKSITDYRKLFQWKSVFAVVEVILAEKCVEHGVVLKDIIKTSKLYKFQLFFHLVFWSCFKGGVDNPDMYLHIDEGQDISIAEYAVLSRVNADVTLNVYGDKNQLIDEKRGISNWTALQNAVEFSNVFELNENYRNTMEITKHCNKTFGYNALPIGTRGSGVRSISMQRLVQELESVSESNHRIAVIAKDESVFSIIPAERGNITYWTAKSVKGIEFDIVYVVDDRLTKNEKYIAYTRALSELIIVS